MTRKEEIINYANSFKGVGVENEELKETIRLAIIDGAEWADAHPIHYDGQAMLYVLRKGVKQGKKEMLDRVIEWLDNNLCCYIGAKHFTIGHDMLNKDLRKAMEE